MYTDETIATLADADRRRLIRTLLENGGRSSIEELAVEIASTKRGAAPGPTAESPDVFGVPERTKIDLVHNHLPRLADHGVIEYDSHNGTVRLDDTSTLEPYVSRVVSRGREADGSPRLVRNDSSE
ncbi:DUF7344 domain-containing protein [Halopiger djelfimassiliensis]|uniref:DUF7344 domain-containing protein n=1 Tax=Halopiger djelfimassiliensis TaxID=1293047 RepID=UPI000677603C|nr:hypothetical protein [Halopiger djelfimassiliensis]